MVEVREQIGSDRRDRKYRRIDVWMSRMHASLTAGRARRRN